MAVFLRRALRRCTAHADCPGGLLRPLRAWSVAIGPPADAAAVATGPCRGHDVPGCVVWDYGHAGMQGPPQLAVPGGRPAPRAAVHESERAPAGVPRPGAPAVALHAVLSGVCGAGGWPAGHGESSGVRGDGARQGPGTLAPTSPGSGPQHTAQGAEDGLDTRRRGQRLGFRVHTRCGGSRGAQVFPSHCGFYASLLVVADAVQPECPSVMPLGSREPTAADIWEIDDVAAQALSNWTEIAKGRAKRDPDKSGESSSSASSASVRAGQATTTSTRTLRFFCNNSSVFNKKMNS